MSGSGIGSSEALCHPFDISGEQRRTRLGELSRKSRSRAATASPWQSPLKPGLVFRRRALELIEEGAVDLLNVNAAVLHRLEGVGQLDQLAGGDIGIGEGARVDEFHAANPGRLSIVHRT